MWGTTRCFISIRTPWSQRWWPRIAFWRIIPAVPFTVPRGISKSGWNKRRTKRAFSKADGERAFFAEGGGGGSLLVSYCLSGVHKNMCANHTMRQNSKKGIDKSLFWVYPRVVKWIHYHRLNIKIKKDAAKTPGILRFRADPSRTKKGCEGTARRPRLCTTRCSWGVPKVRAVWF